VTRYHSLFLISLNPYKHLPIYTPQIVASYRNKRREDRPPHIYAIAERAWCQMGEERECQSVLITWVAVFAVNLGWQLGADVADF
jgi:myosin protein heavy chain